MAKCFVITPYGKKRDADGNIVDFDAVFNAVIEGAVREAGLDLLRSDKDLESGPIFRKMISDIATSEVCIADITTLNPNVFYELGVRHALCRGVTVMIRKEGHPLPFDIQGLRVFAYGPPESDSFKVAVDQIVAAIQHGRDNPVIDSLVFHSLPELAVTVAKPKPIQRIRRSRFALKKNVQRHLGIIGGNLADVRGISVWVNSENTDMQMSRYFDPTISGTIRYLGATKKADGRVKEDLIADDLEDWLHRHEITAVMPGMVIRTTSGELARAPHGVKFILHVAAVHATPGRGYHPVSDLHDCVKKTLKKLDENSEEFGGERTSILLPLLGTGAGGGKIEHVVPKLFDAALDYLEDEPETIIDTVWFLAYSEQHWEVCMQAFKDLRDPH